MHNRYKNYNMILQPINPIKLLKVNVLHDMKNHKMLQLKCEQCIVFKNVGFLIGKYLSLSIPKYIYDNNNNIVTLSMSVGSDNNNNIKICNVNGTDIKCSITLAPCDTSYYINIPIDHTMYDDCDLHIYFHKLNIFISDNTKHTMICNDMAWKWTISAMCD